MYSFEELYRAYNQYADEHPFDQNPQGLYEPVDYILNLGGKKLRPILTLMSTNIFSDSIQAALPAAYSMEIFHNFSLVHDDIMDEAPLRRGKTTVHTKYDLNTGILSGDVMLIYCYEYLAKVPQQLFLETIKTFNKVAIEVCEGQQYDVDFETDKHVTIPQYIKMIEYKTGALISGCLKIGALIGGASAEDAAHLEAFGRNIGIAFQLQDDILDTYGDPEKFGKKVGGDIIQNKKTFLVLKTYELASSEDAERLSELMNTSTENETEKIEAVRSIFGKVDIKNVALAEKNKYSQKAFEHLEAVNVTAEKKEMLYAIAKKLVDREV